MNDIEITWQRDDNQYYKEAIARFPWYHAFFSGPYIGEASFDGQQAGTIRVNAFNNRLLNKLQLRRKIEHIAHIDFLQMAPDGSNGEIGELIFSAFSIPSKQRSQPKLYHTLRKRLVDDKKDFSTIVNLERIHVDTQYRHRGVGRTLINSALSRFTCRKTLFLGKAEPFGVEDVDRVKAQERLDAWYENLGFARARIPVSLMYHNAQSLKNRTFPNCGMSVTTDDRYQTIIARVIKCSDSTNNGVFDEMEQEFFASLPDIICANSRFEEGLDYLVEQWNAGYVAQRQIDSLGTGHIDAITEKKRETMIAHARKQIWWMPGDADESRQGVLSPLLYHWSRFYVSETQ